MYSSPSIGVISDTEWTVLCIIHIHKKESLKWSQRQIVRHFPTIRFFFELSGFISL